MTPKATPRLSSDLEGILALVRVAIGRPLDIATLDCVAAATSKGLVQLASVHALLPLLAQASDQAGVSAHLEDGLDVFLAEIRRSNRERNAALRVQLAEIAEALAAADLEGVVLKGGAELLDPVYPDATRFVLDLDILLPEGDLPAATRILHDLGYAFLGDHPDFAMRRHLAPLHHPAHVAVVELHRRIGDARWNATLPPELIRARSIASPYPGLRMADLATRYLHAIIHGQVDGEAGTPEPMKLRDLAELEFLGRRLPRSDRDFVRGRCEIAGTAFEHDAAEAVHASLLDAPQPRPMTTELAAWVAAVRADLASPSRKRFGYLLAWIARYAHRFVHDREARAAYLRRLISPSYLLYVFRWHRSHVQNIR